MGGQYVGGVGGAAWAGCMGYGRCHGTDNGLFESVSWVAVRVMKMPEKVIVLGAWNRVDGCIARR